MTRFSGYSLLFILATAGSNAAAETPAVTPATGFLQILLALFFILALIFSGVWLLKRFSPAIAANRIPLKVLGNLSVGNKERIMIIEAGDQWLIVGVTANNIQTLGTLPKQESLLSAGTADSSTFQDWLRHTLEKKKSATADH